MTHNKEQAAQPQKSPATAKIKPQNATAVPSGRLSRLLGITRLAAGLAGGMVAEGVRQWGSGRSPILRDMLLTPANAHRISDELARMRGAAMKIGQMLSMDTGDLIPPELTEILSRLRADARTMPHSQLNRVLGHAYGKNWRERFRDFDYQPLAAASIGEVHRAITTNGEDIVLKIQYPGVRASISSDVDNVATLLRLSGLLPRGLDISPLLTAAKAQLREEADYRKEAEHLSAFSAALANNAGFVVPRVLPELTTSNILAMTYVESSPIESIAAMDEPARSLIVKRLVDLLMKELFELSMIQSDPNFANYRYQPENGRIVLLDFGATRHLPATRVADYKTLVRALLADDEATILRKAIDIGYLHTEASAEFSTLVLEMFRLIGRFLGQHETLPVRQSDLAARLTEKGLLMKHFRDDWRTPPVDILLLHRKLGGLFLLASRMDTSLAMRPLIEPYL